MHYPRNLIFQFINAACEGEGIEDVGLLMGQTTSLQTMGEFGQLLLGAKTVGDYLTRGCRFITPAVTSKSPTCGRVKIPQARRQEWVDC